MPNDLPPPNADAHLASKYIDWIIDLINKDKLIISKSDLSKFGNLASMKDHYRINLEAYEVEISHSKHPEIGEDIFVMIFNNIKKIDPALPNQRAILAYVNLTREQFEKIKTCADNQVDRQKREAAEKRFKEAMTPIDQVLDQISNKENSSSDPDEKSKKESKKEKPLPEPMALPPVPESAQATQSVGDTSP